MLGSILRPAVTPRRLVPAVAALSVLAAACGGGGGDGTSDEPTAAPVPDSTSMPAGDATMNGDDTAGDDTTMNGADTAGADTAADATAGADAARQRCFAGFDAMERRVEAEGFEWPDEGPELSEEALEQLLTPEYPNVDGVASPEERPPIEPIPAFDPETVPIPELDHLVGACIEGGIVTEAELFGEEGDEGEGDWCAELAGFDADLVAEFAAHEGEDVVRAEFAECGLPDPLGS